MPRNPKLHSEMVYHVRRDRAISSDGQEFVFNPNKAKERRAAIAKAVSASNAHAKTMESQAGRELTASERSTGKHDIPAEPSQPRSLKKPRDPDAALNSAIDSVRRSSATTPALRATRDRRLEAMERVASKREEQHIAAELSAAHFADPETVRMIRSVEALQAAAHGNPSTPPSELRAIDNLVNLTRSTVGLTKAGYMAMLQAAGLAKGDPAASARETGLNDDDDDVASKFAAGDYAQPGEPANG